MDHGIQNLCPSVYEPSVYKSSVYEPSVYEPVCTTCVYKPCGGLMEFILISTLYVIVV